MIWIWVALLTMVVATVTGAVVMFRRRAGHLWLRGYLAHRRRVKRLMRSNPTHVFFCIVDHFEPGNGGVGPEVQRRRVEEYVRRLPEVTAGFRDADGRLPVQTFFYPVEQYDPELFEAMSPLVAAGLVEIEVHLHHDRDTSENLRRTLERAKELYAGHGYLCRERGVEGVRYGFVHGNWALDNSLPGGRWCGVNDELSVLRQTGCYADFTFPSAPSLSQPRTVNAIYYATDDPQRPRSHDFGAAVSVGSEAAGDLLIVQGPLGPDWKRRKWGLIPRLENGEISGTNPPTPGRVDLWVRQHVHVEGRPEWVFVKVHTHGAVERNSGVLLGETRGELHRYLASRYNDGKEHRLHYVSARELVNLVQAARDGRSGEPDEYRNYRLVRLESLKVKS